MARCRLLTARPSGGALCSGTHHDNINIYHHDVKQVYHLAHGHRHNHNFGQGLNPNHDQMVSAVSCLFYEERPTS